MEFKEQFRRGDLREILRGVRKQIKERALYAGKAVEEMVFVCTVPAGTTCAGGLSFVHFEEREGRQPKLRSFGFTRETIGETFTLRTVNLPALKLTTNLLGEVDWTSCEKAWRGAWDVEKVTEAFFMKYVEVFQKAEQQIKGFDTGAEARQLHLFTQRLFNRLLFVQFLSKRGWLTFNGSNEYLFALWEGRDQKENFYSAHLVPLFFAGLNNPQSLNLVNDNPALFARIGTVPFLNGGLFEQTKDDKRENIFIPDDVFAAIFQKGDGDNEGFFRRYNFTITESSPDDADVAVDPEMLGRVFEKLILKEDRSEKGAFYTPRSIVQFMCRESIKGYLKDFLPNPTTPDAITQLVDEYNDNAVTLSEARILNHALENLRVVDPACGSGAYLLGMTQVLFDLLTRLDTRAERPTPRTDYDRKLLIIQRTLYGVDLEEFAVNIAMLRLWLSLIVDYKESSVHNLPPLPNLDFKIEVGDSLSAPDPRVQGDIFRSRLLDDAEAIAALKRRHFHATDGTKATLAQQIREKEAELAAEFAQNAATTMPANAFDWRIRFIEVFRPQRPIADIGGGFNFGDTLAERPAPGGFHIVLANPPYGGTPVSDDIVKRMFPRPANDAQSNDLYGIFMARALELLVPGKGQFCFIVSNTWRTIKSFKPLRVRLARETTVRHVLDLPNWIFKATVNTGIITLTNTPPPAEHSLIAGDLTGIANGDWNALEGNLALIAGHGADIQTPTYARYTYPQQTIGTYANFSFFIASPRLYSLMSDARFTKLGSIADVKVGLQTGDNEYYLRKKEGVRGSYRL